MESDLSSHEGMEKMDKEYDTIVLSGGAARGFGLLGAMQYIQDQNKLSGIKKCIGCSIGAIILYLLCIGYTPTELMVILCQKHLLPEKISKQFDIMNIFHGSGAVPFHVLQEFLEKLTIHKIKRYITLLELHTRFEKELVCCTYNATLFRPEYISYRSHPNLDCITALRMSSNLPFLFEPFQYDDYRYIDGGLVDNFPVMQVSPEDTAIGVRVCMSPSTIDDKEDQNMLSEIMSMVFIPMARIEQLTMDMINTSMPNVDAISVDIPCYMSYKFNVSNTDKFDMFSKGYETMRKHFRPNDSPLYS